MAKIRVHELAKNLDKSSKDIISLLEKKGIEGKKAASGLTEEEEKIVKSVFAPKAGAIKKETVKKVVTQKEPIQKKTVVKKEAALKESPTKKTDARESVRREMTGKEMPKRPMIRKEPPKDASGKPIFRRDSTERRVRRDNVGKESFRRDNAGKESFRRDNTGKEPFRRDNSGKESFRRDNTGKEPFRRDNAGRESFRRDNAGKEPFRRDNTGKESFKRDGSDRDNRRNMQRKDAPRRDGAGKESVRRDAQGKEVPRRDPARREAAKREVNRKERLQSEGKSFEEKKKRESLDVKKNGNTSYNKYRNFDGDDRQRNAKKINKKNDQFTVKGTKPINKPIPKPVPKEPEEPVIRTIYLPETLTVQEFASKIKTPVAQLIKKLFLANKIVNVNSDLNFDEAAEMALEYNYIAEEEIKVDAIEELLKETEEDESLMTERPPVVCVMGHVDHGKTSLLDAIRETSVILEESGGITQHIGAYTVKVNKQKITFLDTPGHEAFTAMRMRGAQATDIAILVVAADDGVMPQTIEAIAHAKAAGIEIIVAINKIDKESANIDRVKQELMEHELIAEDWGGKTVFCPVSAHTKDGIGNLLEMILLTAEVLELKANPNRNARGIVIEAELDKGRGPVATMLVQKGTLKIGDAVAVGNSYGKVRAMVNDKGKKVKEAKPSTPVEILGLNGVPDAGEVFIATENEKEARSMAETYIAYGKEKLLADTKHKMSLDDLFTQIQAGNVKELNLVVKADVQGSVEAVKQSLLKLSNEEVVIKIIHAGVGAISESDVILASASNAIIIGFHVRPDVTAKEISEREKVDLRLYKIIYNAIEDIEAAMKGMLDPIYEEKVTGHVEIRQIYKASGVGTIAGSYVLDGVIRKKSSVRVSRGGEQIFEGMLASLKRFQDDAKEVKAGFECGLVFEGFHDIKEEDQIEAYEMVEVPR